METNAPYSMIDAVENYIFWCEDIEKIKAMLMQTLNEGTRNQFEELYYSFIQ